MKTGTVNYHHQHFIVRYGIGEGHVKFQIRWNCKLLSDILEESCWHFFGQEFGMLSVSYEWASSSNGLHSRTCHSYCQQSNMTQSHRHMTSVEMAGNVDLVCILRAAYMSSHTLYFSIRQLQNHPIRQLSSWSTKNNDFSFFCCQVTFRLSHFARALIKVPLLSRSGEARWQWKR